MIQVARLLLLLFSRSVVSRLFATLWSAAPQAFLSFTISWSLFKLMPYRSNQIGKLQRNLQVVQGRFLERMFLTGSKELTQNSLACFINYRNPIFRFLVQSSHSVMTNHNILVKKEEKSPSYSMYEIHTQSQYIIMYF